MLLRTFTVAIALQLFGAPANAVGESDNGIYLVVNTKGEVTTKAFRVSQRGAEWAIEDRKPDGSWSDVTCAADCRMSVSSEANIQQFFPTSTLSQITPDCIHSKAFAFCGYSLKSNAGFRGYLFVALTEGQPIVLRLARVIADK
jgi:hypothetical protein